MISLYKAKTAPAARPVARLSAGLAAALAALLICAGALACTTTLTGCASSSTPTGASTLTVGVRGDIVGFGYLNEKTGKHNGLEIDIANELAERLGYSDVEFVTVVPDDRKEKLLNGEVDCLIACYSIADSRLENFDFSPTYYTDDSILLLQNSSLITSIDQLKGRTIGTMAGANTAPQLVAKLKELGFTDGNVVSQSEDEDAGTVTYVFDNFTIYELASYQELSDALETGVVDAAAMDKSISGTYMADDRNVLDGFSIAQQEYGVATQKDSDLSQPVSDAIQAMLDDGTIESLIDKWD